MIVRRVRLVSGLVLLTYLATHFINHALGLISLEAMEAGRIWFWLCGEIHWPPLCFMVRWPPTSGLRFIHSIVAAICACPSGKLSNSCSA